MELPKHQFTFVAGRDRFGMSIARAAGATAAQQGCRSVATLRWMTMGRRGPRNDVDVPTMLLDTAERLFGPQSMHEVSLRAVAREAGVAPSRVGRLLRGVIAQQAKKGAAKRRPRSMRALRLTSPWAWAGGLVSSANQLVEQSPAAC